MTMTRRPSPFAALTTPYPATAGGTGREPAKAGA